MARSGVPSARTTRFWFSTEERARKIINARERHTWCRIDNLRNPFHGWQGCCNCDEWIRRGSRRGPGDAPRTRRAQRAMSGPGERNACRIARTLETSNFQGVRARWFIGGVFFFSVLFFDFHGARVRNVYYARGCISPKTRKPTYDAITCPGIRAEPPRRSETSLFLCNGNVLLMKSPLVQQRGVCTDDLYSRLKRVT